MPFSRSLFSSLEMLEARVAPASLVTIHASTKTATWTDVDGDLVTLKWTGSATPVFADHAPAHGVANGTLVDSIKLTNVNDALTVMVKGVAGGDGHVNLGYIDATGVPLRSFSAPLASVLEFDAGDTLHAVGSLVLGSYGTISKLAFSSPGGNSAGTLDGNVGVLKIAGDLQYGSLSVGHLQGSNDPVRSTNGSILIGGSLRGNLADSTDFNGNLTVRGTTGSVRIAGSVLGGSFGSGDVSTGPVRSFSIGGDLVGGSTIGTGQVTIGSDSLLTTVSVGGSVVGVAYDSGSLTVVKAKSVVIGGNVEASSSYSGFVTVVSAGTVVIKGSILGAQVLNPTQDLPTAGLKVQQHAGTVVIGHNIVSGTTTHTDQGTAVDTRNGFIGGSGTIDTLMIGGSVEGNNNTRVILSALGVTPATAGNFNAIGHVMIKGGFNYGILASGQASTGGTLSTAENPDAGIGSVTIGGGYYHSSIMAGTDDLGALGVGAVSASTSADTQSGGDPSRHAVLGPVHIAGAVLDDVDASGYSGFEGEQITRITVGGQTAFTHGSPLHYFDPTQYIFALEIPAT